MHVKLRYVERRVDRSGAERWYWHRRGHKLTRLPDNAIERMTMAERLNAAADSLAPAELDSRLDRLGDPAIPRQRRISGSKPGHGQILQEVPSRDRGAGPALPFASFTRRAVVDFIESYSKALSAAPIGRGPQEPVQARPISRRRYGGRDRRAAPENEPAARSDLDR